MVKQTQTYRNKQIAKKKKESKKENFNSVQEWFWSNITRAKYQMHHGDDWWWKMNEVHDKILEKLIESCEEFKELDENETYQFVKK